MLAKIEKLPKITQCISNYFRSYSLYITSLINIPTKMVISIFAILALRSASLHYARSVGGTLNLNSHNLSKVRRDPGDLTAKTGERYVIKRFLSKNPGLLPGFRIFYRPKPGQFHVDPGNLNFMKIC